MTARIYKPYSDPGSQFSLDRVPRALHLVSQTRLTDANQPLGRGSKDAILRRRFGAIALSAQRNGTSRRAALILFGPIDEQKGELLQFNRQIHFHATDRGG